MSENNNNLSPLEKVNRFLAYVIPWTNVNGCCDDFTSSVVAILMKKYIELWEISFIKEGSDRTGYVEDLIMTLNTGEYKVTAKLDDYARSTWFHPLVIIFVSERNEDDGCKWTKRTYIQSSGTTAKRCDVIASVIKEVIKKHEERKVEEPIQGCAQNQYKPFKVDSVLRTIGETVGFCEQWFVADVTKMTMNIRSSPINWTRDFIKIGSPRTRYTTDAVYTLQPSRDEEQTIQLVITHMDIQDKISVTVRDLRNNTILFDDKVENIFSYNFSWLEEVMSMVPKPHDPKQSRYRFEYAENVYAVLSKTAESWHIEMKTIYKEKAMYQAYSRAGSGVVVVIQFLLWDLTEPKYQEYIFKNGKPLMMIQGKSSTLDVERIYLDESETVHCDLLDWSSRSSLMDDLKKNNPCIAKA